MFSSWGFLSLLLVFWNHPNTTLSLVMGTAVQVQLSNGFVNFANSFASSYTAGIFNLLFIPKEDEATGQTVLQFASFAGLTDLRVAHQSFIGRVQNIPVWSVLPEESQFGPVKHNIYWILLLILALICLIALVIACVLLTITCCCGKCMKNGCNRKKKMKVITYKWLPVTRRGTCYMVYFEI